MILKISFKYKQGSLTKVTSAALSLSMALTIVPSFAFAKADEDIDCGSIGEMTITPSNSIAGSAASSIVLNAEIDSTSIRTGDELLVNVFVSVGGRKVRSLSKSSKATEDGLVSIPISWDLKSAKGNPVRDDSYQITATVKRTKESNKKARQFHPLSAKTYLIIDKRDVLAKTAIRTASLHNGLHTPDESTLVNGSQKAEFPFKLFFGVNHSHTKYSDGGIPLDSDDGKGTATPMVAYEYARDKGKLNFLGITDHNHMLDNKCKGCSKDKVKERYAQSFLDAKAVSEPDKFLGIYGMEWGYYNPGHLNLYNQPKIFNWDAEPKHVDVGPTAYTDVYKKNELPSNQAPEGSVVCFNHPKPKDFNNLKMPTKVPEFVTGMAIVNGPSHTRHHKFDGKSGEIFDAQYEKALGMGWRIGPEAHQDNHYINYGTSTTNRTVVLIPKNEKLTLKTYIQALKNRRFYASQDKNAHLYYSVNTGRNFMGDSIDSTAPVSVEIEVFDPSDEEVGVIEVLGAEVTGNSKTIAHRVLHSVNSNMLVAAIPREPAGQRWFYYVHVIQKDGDSIWSAPVWINWR